MSIAKGLIKIDDYVRFGRLVDRLEALGAYLVTYSPRRKAVFAWFRGKDAPKAEEWLKGQGLGYAKKAGRGNGFVMFAIDWGR